MLRKYIIVAGPKFVSLVLACMLASLWTGPAQATSSEEVLAIYDLAERGEYDEANARLQTLLDEEDQDARGLLGLFYLHGLGRKHDPHKAYELCKESAQHEQPMGLHCMGHVYAAGISGKVERDYQQSVYWWSKAVAKGDIESMTHLANHYYQGFGVEKDEQEALWLWQKAAEAGDKYALVQLGYMYEEGLVVEKDLDKKFEYWYAALQAGGRKNFKGVQLWVGEQLLERYDDEQHWQEGIGLIRELGDEKYPHAWLRMGYLCLTGIYLARDLECAKHWYEKAAKSNTRPIWFTGNIGLMTTKLFSAVGGLFA